MNGTLRLPPGPKALPIIGNLHLIGHLPNQSLHHLAQTYGPIMYLKLGFMPTIVISSPEIAELILKTNDLLFSNRQRSEFGLLYGSKGFAFNDYGPYWRSARKLAVSQVLGSGKVISFSSLMEEELSILIEDVKEKSNISTNNPFVSIKKKVISLTGNIICRMVLGRKCFEEKINEELSFGELCHEITGLFGHFNVGDYLPFLKWFDVHGLAKHGKVVLDLVRGFVDQIIDDHLLEKNLRNEKKNSSADFIDFLLLVMHDKNKELALGLDFDRSNIISIVMDTILGATDTLPSSLEWAMVEIVRNSEVMKKMKEELERVIGNDRRRMIKVSDLPGLKYLAMVVKESLRLHPPGPLLGHKSSEDCDIGGGLYVPKDCNVLVNVWAIGRDCKVWTNAEEFLPERFESSFVDVKGSDFRLLPFGSGRRACPGMNFSLTMIPLVLANLMHCFDWEIPDGISASQIDMQEKYEGNRIKHIKDYKDATADLSEPKK
ncbi:cytochrome P450 family 1 subfamily A polypeptide 1 protein [Dioscorea alata]|uniref:Cytochrome P450 family 1 subfamily A polypeptide 1 protein n=1 Tax=Dioscorea alata TaxID=55571 RepID=A0ACB7WS12_DIOAL|nr:cytochrome P450 family 1 subfamily A polypeptide 1 protein [Dioscorea alata]